MTLIGEARLWYKSLAPLDNDWPALQNKFRWQYSKIGNTPEQLFHAWRTFKFDENTDSVDSYALAKRVLTKEKLDRQLTGQSSTPFMKATNNNDCHLPQNQQKKGVTFDAMEMLERNSDCIDRLTSLVSDLKITMDRKPQYKPKIYQGRTHETKMLDDKILLLEIDPLVEEGIKAMETITGKIIEIDQEAGDRSGNYPNYNRQGNTRPYHRQNAQWTSRNRSQSRSRNENYGNNQYRGRSRDRNPRRQEGSRSRSNSRVSTNRDRVRCYRCREYDHFASECPNTPTDEETDYEDADPASLQIMSQSYGPNDSEREGEYLNL